jgi:hypothetical protein
MNESYDCDDNEEDEYNRSADDLGIRELTEHRVLQCGIAATAMGEWEDYSKVDRPTTQSIMGGQVYECWTELHTAGLSGS